MSQTIFKPFSASLLTTAVALLVAACGGGVKPDAAPAGTVSGLDLQSIDPKVNAADNFDRHFNGAWQDAVMLPADHAAIGPIVQVQDATLEQLKVIVQGTAASAGNPMGSEPQKVGDLYASYMDQPRRDAQGVKPLKDELARIGKLKGKNELGVAFVHLQAIGVAVPYTLQAAPSLEDPNKMVGVLQPGGLSLPGSAYYTLDYTDEKILRTRFVEHVTRVFAMAGEKSPAQSAAEVMQIESALAAGADATAYNEAPATASPDDLGKFAGAIDWPSYFKSSAINGRIDTLKVLRPNWFAAESKVIAAQPLGAWQSYLKWQLLRAYEPYLSSAFTDESFAFWGRTARGIPQAEPRELQATRLTSELLDDALGKLYVATDFQDALKDRANQMTGRLVEALRAGINGADWLSADSKQRSLDKLAKLQLKIGYTEFWKDYTSLTIARDDLVGNVMRARRFEYLRTVGKIGQPRDHDEWPFAPQATMVRYDRAANELVIPAAVLQAPIFNAAADDAANYGALGTLIAHELSRGFDEAGSLYLADGKQGFLWNDGDRQKFIAKTRVLVNQYAIYEPAPGTRIDGERTLSENVADVAGLQIAHRAFVAADPSSPLIDGLTGDQRFYAAWNQLMREKSRLEEILRLLLTAQIAPQPVRGVLPLAHQAAFYNAYSVHTGSQPFLPPAARLSLWQ